MILIAFSGYLSVPFISMYFSISRIIFAVGCFSFFPSCSCSFLLLFSFSINLEGELKDLTSLIWKKWERERDRVKESASTPDSKSHFHKDLSSYIYIILLLLFGKILAVVVDAVLRLWFIRICVYVAV